MVLANPKLRSACGTAGRAEPSLSIHADHHARRLDQPIGRAASTGLNEPAEAEVIVETIGTPEAISQRDLEGNRSFDDLDDVA